ncbi:inosine/xanthosine triphosphatase [Paraglaciecola sp. MB-3u-78]|jgi:inosine/xanthosine triphosphatase|uniref:inosine/xanthosine triphosphatase n=1 Tax=Paraglaciecola sp. MB-3u-78 TaxID=2058332 RepID=UPI000C33633B|nr:inosine/xanthosine triphosphatase [Paraglaciecola sp. MB-3u-78]PKG98324.1 non-canonical purine NTP phosphatase [Paraglaciecola sp. MB-3u-78]
MIKIIVGSKNPVKISAAQKAICDVLSLKEVECVGINAPSSVAEQPMTTEETKLGAINRIEYCQQHTQADFYVAIEGGVDSFEYGPATFAFVAIANKTHMSIGRSCNLPLPPVIYQALKSGEELGHVMDRLFNTDNIKQKGGAIGLLTNGLATRESVYRQAILLAMAPFIHPDLYT